MNVSVCVSASLSECGCGCECECECECSRTLCSPFSVPLPRRTIVQDNCTTSPILPKKKEKLARLYYYYSPLAWLDQRVNSPSHSYSSRPTRKTVHENESGGIQRCSPVPSAVHDLQTWAIYSHSQPFGFFILFSPTGLAFDASRRREEYGDQLLACVGIGTEKEPWEVSERTGTYARKYGQPRSSVQNVQDVQKTQDNLKSQSSPHVLQRQRHISPTIVHRRPLRPYLLVISYPHEFDYPRLSLSLSPSSPATCFLSRRQ